MRKPDINRDLENLEKCLEMALIPIKPRPGFVADLRQRLTQPPAVALDKRRQPTNLWTLVGIISGALLLISGIAGILNYLRRSRLSETSKAPLSA